MDRQALLDDIRVLTSLLTRADAHERRMDEAHAQDAHLELQVARLEDAAVKIERRLIELDATDATEAEAELFDQERAQLRARLSTLQAKAADLRRAALENEIFDATAFAARPPGVPARLRATLHALVRDMHADPTIPPADIRPFQSRLAELVRERRSLLFAAADRVENARDYLTSIVSILDELAPMLGDIGDAAATGAFPFPEERSLAATRVEMARVAVKEARAALEALAHDWPELAPISGRPDWKKLPFGQLAELLVPRDERAATRHGPFADRHAETLEMARALALWLEELRRAVAGAPAPS